MVKKISFYTAFGQFIEMVEQQMEKPESLKDTDWFQCEHTLSDYQDAINSDIQMKSCPIESCSLPIDVRKTSSCPLAAFPSLPPVVSPVPTSIESRKMNEAAEMMMSFWKIHVTLRKKQEEIPSLFEKLDGIFTSSSFPSLFEKMEGMFASEEESSLFEKLDGFFASSVKSEHGVQTDPSWNSIPSIKEEEETLEGSMVTEGPSTDNFMCCSCKTTWSSLDNPAVPQLPVFVKSPIDSLKIYEAAKFHQNTGEMADDERSSPSQDSSMSSSSVSSDSGTIVIQRTNNACLKKTISLQREAIERQEKIIRYLLQLNDLYSKLPRAE